MIVLFLPITSDPTPADTKDKRIMVDRSKIKISVAKLIEIAYSSDEGLTKKIVLGSDNFKVTVNENGRATLSGSAGTLTFQGEQL